MGSLLTFLLIGLVALIVAGVVLAVIGLVISATLALAGFVLFKLVPIVLVGYLLVRFLTPRRHRLTAEDRKWLEGG